MIPSYIIIAVLIHSLGCQLSQAIHKSLGYNNNIIITPRTCARGKVISRVVVIVVVVVSTKIAISKRLISTTNQSYLAKNWLQCASN